MLDTTRADVADACAETCLSGLGPSGAVAVGHPDNMPQHTAPDAGPRWFCVQSHPQAERWALENLKAQEWETYLPMEDVRVPDRVIRTMTHVVSRPWIKGYLFVRFDRDRDPWGPICNTRGVARLLRTPAGRPVPVPDAEVTRIMDDEPNRRIQPAAPLDDLTGQAVRIKDGVWAGYAGMCEAGADERVAIWTTHMNDLALPRPVRMSVRRGQVELV